jgi:hypothetical protein
VSRARASIDLRGLVELIHRLARQGDLPQHLLASPLGAGTRLERLGLDSLGNLTLLEELEQWTGLELPDEALDPGCSLAEVVERLNALEAVGTT